MCYLSTPVSDNPFKDSLAESPVFNTGVAGMEPGIFQMMSIITKKQVIV
jgi:hypothetical protein